MKFRTDIAIPPLEWSIDYQTPMLCMGSCFADRMGRRLREAKFPATVNPMGIVYNPLSLAQLLERWHRGEGVALSQGPHGLWHSFALHSHWSGADRQELEARIEAGMAEAAQALDRASVLLLTFGTAYVYERRDTGELVANCHKYPGAFFRKRLLTVREVVKAWKPLVQRLRERQPELKLLLTVSPVRHKKEGLANNGLSKAVLRLACDQLVQALDGTAYFPAYEIMMDDLRDYRFYGDDLIHPTPFAQAYIWEHFAQTCLSDLARELTDRWEKLRTSMAHRPMQAASEAHREFLRQLLRKLEELNEQLHCEAEIETIRTRMRLSAEDHA